MTYNVFGGTLNLAQSVSRISDGTEQKRHCLRTCYTKKF